MTDDARPRLRIAIVDDEDLARAVVREYLAGVPDVEIVAECANGFEAVKAVAELRPDLLLLDVQMPKLNGFEVLDLVGRDVAVIFVTAYDQYALRAFEVHAVDYLLKPFSAERLAEAIARARERAGRGEKISGRRRWPRPRGPGRASPDGSSSATVRACTSSPSRRSTTCRRRTTTSAFAPAGKDYLKEQTLADVEASLDPARFVRIHRSYLLNLERLARVELDARENRIAILTDGSRLPVSRAGYARLNALLGR